MLKATVFLMVVAVSSAAQIRGIVTPVEDCGGEGIPLQLRIEGCTGRPPCTIIPARDYLIEGDFTASANSEAAKFTLIATLASGQVIPVSEGELGGLIGGVTYTARQTIRISNALSGQSVVAQIKISDVPTERVEICIEAAMRVQ